MLSVKPIWQTHYEPANIRLFVALHDVHREDD
jgi:hypothetical protein